MGIGRNFQDREEKEYIYKWPAGRSGGVGSEWDGPFMVMPAGHQLRDIFIASQETVKKEVKLHKLNLSTSVSISCNHFSQYPETGRHSDTENELRFLVTYPPVTRFTQQALSLWNQKVNPGRKIRGLFGSCLQRSQDCVTCTHITTSCPLNKAINGLGTVSEMI